MARPKHSQGALAKQLGITRQAVGALVKRGMPLGVEAAIEWRKENLDQELVKSARHPPRRGPSPEESALRQRKLKAQTLILERMAAQDSGEQFSALALERALASFDGWLRNSTIGVGSTLEGQLLASGCPRDGLRTLLCSWEEGIVHGVHVSLRKALQSERIRVKDWAE